MFTTAQAAKVAGITPAAFRREMNRLRTTGTDLRLPLYRWPDARTPLYDEDAVRAWMQDRPGRGAGGGRPPKDH